MLRQFYYEAFSGAHVELRTVATDTVRGIGVVEGIFRCQCSPFFELGDGDGGQEIRQGRLYYDSATLLRQLGQSA